MTKRGTGSGSTFHRHSMRLASHAAPFHYGFYACFLTALTKLRCPIEAAFGLFASGTTFNPLNIGYEVHHMSPNSADRLGSTYHKLRTRRLLHNEASPSCTSRLEGLQPQRVVSSALSIQIPSLSYPCALTSLYRGLLLQIAPGNKLHVQPK